MPILLQIGCHIVAPRQSSHQSPTISTILRKFVELGIYHEVRILTCSFMERAILEKLDGDFHCTGDYYIYIYTKYYHFLLLSDEVLLNSSEYIHKCSFLKWASLWSRKNCRKATLQKCFQPVELYLICHGPGV